MFLVAIKIRKILSSCSSHRNRQKGDEHSCSQIKSSDGSSSCHLPVVDDVAAVVVAGDVVAGGGGDGYDVGCCCWVRPRCWYTV